ncbi:hypothetical protein J3B02_001071 [Coemansia erecta]|uniref:Uncharacterized protein n=1 Tax=Coemansia asiatica TaxID=1052880 RepID=A0A9W8CGD2_9FUNG|nr:hypothetical protein LPJ64_006071 [Coemansia asiatica]KAJ2857327.1 hypothetical protein J3B02_001071 [Coemansia erecta]KAJ2888763.1 hypothetical protein FB639_000411 [Coemansia asiatica]
MEPLQIEITRILSALQGTSDEPATAPAQPPPAAQDTQQTQHEPLRRRSVWAVPASVGSDLARGTTLSAIAQMWDNLEEVQKLNIIFGMVHVGVDKVHDKQAARTIATLSTGDASSDWVRTVGGLLGPVGTTGQMGSIDDLAAASRQEIEDAIGQIADAVGRGVPGPLTTSSLTFAARPQASAQLRGVYGVKPRASEIARITEAATMRVRDGPASKDAPMFTDLFGDNSDDDDEDAAEQQQTALTLALNTRPSLAVDHVGRMQRILAASESQRRPASAGPVAASTGRPHMPGARPPMMQRQPTAGSSSKVGMLNTRRRTAPSNTALPSTGLPQAQAAGAQKRIRVMDLAESAGSVHARERLMEQQRLKKAEEREAKLQKQQAEAAERKRKREEARERRLAADAAKRQRQQQHGNSTDDGEVNDDRSDDSSSSDEALSAQLPRAFSVPPPDEDKEYLSFTGHDDQVRAVYTKTNALSDIDRLRMYCFFNSKPMPEGTGSSLEIVLNEEPVENPAKPGTIRYELLMFLADLTRGEWKKVRRFRNPSKR